MVPYSVGSVSCQYLSQGGPACIINCYKDHSFYTIATDNFFDRQPLIRGIKQDNYELFGVISKCLS